MITRYIFAATLVLIVLWSPLLAEKRLAGLNGLADVADKPPAADSGSESTNASAMMDTDLTAKSAILSGGEVSSSASFRARDAFGSVVAGVTQSQDFIVYQGFLEGVSPAPFCLAGDADGNGTLDIDDSVYLLAYIFSSGPVPAVEFCCADANGDGAIDVDDVVYMIAHCFSGGPDPVGSC